MTYKTIVAIMVILALVAGIMLIREAGRGLKVAPPPKDAQIGKIELSPCKVKIGNRKFIADCGLIIVPENWQAPGAQRIALPVTRIRALSSTPAEPIFYLEGGPGMSNMKAQPPIALLDTHDFVMVGYRGVDGSVRLDCPAVSAALKGDGKDLLGNDSLDMLGRAMLGCAARLSRQGIDLDRYTIPDVVRDMEAARRALGFERINLYSRSYGTRIAQIYATEHPDVIRRSLIVGANPPGRFVWERATIDTQIRRFADRRAISGNGDDLVRAMRKVSRAMPARWLGLRIDPGKVKAVSFALMFNTRTAALVFDAWEAAGKGDASGLALMSIAYDFVLPRMFVYGDFFAKALSADLDPARDYGTSLNPSGSIIGSPLSALFFSAAQRCDGPCWPMADLEDKHRTARPSPVETLILSGGLDFSTPAQYAARELLPMLPNGRQIVLADMGHVDDLTQSQPEAFAHLASRFFDDGEAVSSLYVRRDLSLRPRWGMPALAKSIAVAAVIAALAAVGALAFALNKLRG